MGENRSPTEVSNYDNLLLIRIFLFEKALTFFSQLSLQDCEGNLSKGYKRKEKGKKKKKDTYIMKDSNYVRHRKENQINLW